MSDAEILIVGAGPTGLVLALWLTKMDVPVRIVDKTAEPGTNWFSVYHVSHRVTEHFRQGRSFLLGDAAHIHTPVGGQGMNTGVGDAIKGLDSGHAGSVHGGERLPWVRAAGFDNYDALKQIGWQVHVYGEAQDALKRWCENRGVPIHIYTWSDPLDAVGLKKDALYLMRPDTYVALANTEQSIAVIESFLEKAQIQL